MKPRAALHLALVALFAMGVGVLFVHEPGFGDDFTYWSFAWELHERGLHAWSAGSFHHLRWPVWGVCWLLQSVLGPGLLSYYGEPLLYLAAGAGLAFTFGRLLTGSLRAGWTAAILFLFHPLLDSVCHRPMPDLSEGVWGGAALLCWWRLQLAPTRVRAALWTAGLGVCIYVAESNRLTGVFIVPVIGIITLLYGRQRLGWVLAAGAVAALCYGAEGFFYRHLFHDFLHNLHANMGAKGKKGTEAIALWILPFRFLGGLWKQSALSPVLALLALLGLGVAWRRRPFAESPAAPAPPLGRVVALWAVLLYLAYACAPQSLWPWRPLLREADRFLAGLTIPMALLAMLGLTEVWARRPRRRWVLRLQEAPVRAGACAVVLLVLFCARPFYSLGFVPEMRRYLRSLPPGTKVFTHRDMRDIAWLADAKTAAGLNFLYANDIIKATPELERLAGEASEFWYARKLVWLNTRKQLELKNVPEQAPLPSYFAHPEADWALARLLAKGDTPDLVFYRRRTPAMPAPLVLTREAPELAGLIPPLPVTWQKSDARTLLATWPVPPALRGQLLSLHFTAAAPQVQAFLATLRFVQGHGESGRAHGFGGWLARSFPHLPRARTRLEAEYMLKPYLHPKPGEEFFVLAVPAHAEECQVQLKIREGAAVDFTGFRAIFEKGLVQPLEGEATPAEAPAPTDE